MLTAEHVRFFLGPEGQALLAEAADLPGDVLARLSRLRRRYSPDVAAAAVETLELRQRARGKFGRAASMYFTPQGLEQASGERTARWRAGRFPEGVTVHDLCCGIGGDAVCLAARGPVEAVDLDSAAAACAEANAEVYEVAERVRVACADVTQTRLSGGAAFLDPSRRAGGRRVRSAEHYSPPLSFAAQVRARVPDLAVKVAPSLDYQALEATGARVEFVSDHGECKEAVLWFGRIGPAACRCASVLPAGATLSADPAVAPPSQSPPRDWVLEPDPAVIRAHLVAEVAAATGAAQLDPHIAWLTTDAPVATPFADAYRVLEWLPFSLKRVQERLRSLDLRVDAIKRRGVPLDPAELRRPLASTGDRPAVVVLTRVAGKPAAILCEPCGRERSDD